ncbi:hypothetical protein EYF80_051576 [Liparis tanakae]|uniref:Uncharacterized protein n=1 Tax=Liparis tanakae TaxID=230148 RepID=A0A4Z2FBV2_9TELE|nr:hypothetical protein EYF80_051576 [Liparis tanakae]
MFRPQLTPVATTGLSTPLRGLSTSTATLPASYSVNSAIRHLAPPNPRHHFNTTSTPLCSWWGEEIIRKERADKFTASLHPAAGDMTPPKGFMEKHLVPVAGDAPTSPSGSQPRCWNIHLKEMS